MAKCIVLLSLFVNFHLLAQSYEGSINDKLFIWMDLKIPSTGSSVSGSYFYEKIGQEIQLEGTKNNNGFVLNEYDKNHSITGIFSFTIKNDTVAGTWSKPNKKKMLPVFLLKVNPEERAYAKLLHGTELYITDGKTLAEEVGNYCGEGYIDENDNPLKTPPPVALLYGKGNVFSVTFSWGYMGPYPSYGTVYHTFDMNTKREITLWEQVDGSKMKEFKKYLCSNIQPLLDEARQQYSDSEWVSVFQDFRSEDASDSDTATILDRYMTITDPETDPVNSTMRSGLNFYLSEEGLVYTIDGYYEFPHVIMAMDVSGSFTIPYAELKKYIKKETPFKGL